MSLIEERAVFPLPLQTQISESSTENIIKQMSINFKEFTLYKAGLPSFPRSFHRDNTISAFLRGDSAMLYNTLQFAASIQGVKKDRRTGEQPGGIYHEFDIELQGGVELKQAPGLTTFYNASDTTALFLLGHQEYISLTGESGFAQVQSGNIERATEYVESHLNSNFQFVEDPNFAGAEKYALKVTSWKDSVLFGREDGEPSYPVVYPLVHIQNMAGVRAAGRILNSQRLLNIADEMRNSALSMFDWEIGNFPTAIDSEGVVRVLTTDGLHSLFYFEPEDLEREMLLSIIESSRVMETEMGYRIMDPVAAKQVENKYHAGTVWTHEQAQIHKGATRFFKHAVATKDDELAKKLLHVMHISSKVYKNFLEENPHKYPEIFHVLESGIIAGGNDPQLWAIAARSYFENINLL